MAFKGWKAEALDFYEGLEADNTKTYWTDNRAVYDELVLAPMQELLAELEPTHGAGKVFRPYRDARFSKDKTPYKTNIGARVGAHGYVQLSAEGLGAGSGMFHLAPDQLTRFREAVDHSRTGADLARRVEKATSTGAELISHGALKTAPRGYAKDHPRVELLRLKGLAVYQAFPVGPWLGTAKAKDRVLAVFELAKPVNAWMERHVGDSELEGWG